MDTLQATAPAARLDPADLVIERIEVVPIRVPLTKRFQGSNYSMTRAARSSRGSTRRRGRRRGVQRRRADDRAGEIVKIITDEIGPSLIGRWTPSTSRAAGRRCCRPRYDILRDRSLALQAHGLRRQRALGRASARRSACRCTSSGAATATGCRSICIGGYYERRQDARRLGREMERYRGLGYRRLQVQGRRPDAGRRTPTRVRAARTAAGDDFVLMVDANQGYTSPRRSTSPASSSDLDIRWFEEPVRLAATTGCDMATCAR